MKIIDVSSNNGTIDWKKVANSGVTDAIIRLSLGYNSKDKKAEENARSATAAGISVSYYHFAYPDLRTGTVDGDAKQEAAYFTSLFQNGNLPAPKWLVVDLEEWEKGKDTPLAPVEYQKWLATFTSEVFRITGIVCIVYSYAWYLNSHLPTAHQLGGLPLWIANYNNVKTPDLPFGWRYYFLWQYSPEGAVPGINGKCDLNTLYRSKP